MPTPLTRLGLHYFPDTLHYRQNDSNQWLPVWQDLRLTWLTLYANSRSSIPEAFLNTLAEHAIKPIIHLHSPLDPPVSLKDLSLLFQLYARWGTKYMILFDRPNLRRSWSQSEWVHTNPVNRFLDIWIPRAESALHAGLVPVLPPLQPGGDYWDTVFLHSLYLGLQQRNKQHLIQNSVLSAYAHTDPDHLAWGRGGPVRWPATRPYFTPEGSENQLGFHIYEWYLDSVESVVGFRPPIILLQAGAPLPHLPSPTSVGQAKSALAILKSLLLAEDLSNPAEIAPLPVEVLACTFWLLAAEPGSTHDANAWFSAPGLPKPSLQYPISWLRQLDQPIADPLYLAR